MEQRVGVVEDDLYAGVDEIVREVLGRCGWHREDRNHDVLVFDHLAQRRVVPDGQRANVGADLLLVGVEHGDHPEAVVGEDVRRRDRRAEVTGAEQSDVVLTRGAQDLADLRHQRINVVAHTSLAELPESRQVAPDLGRVDVGVVGELLRGDRLLAHLARLG